MFLNDCRPSSERIIRFPAVEKCGVNIGFQDYHGTSGGVPRRILVWLALRKSYSGRISSVATRRLRTSLARLFSIVSPLPSLAGR